MPRAVVLAGGWAHPSSDLAAAMRNLLGARGFTVAVVTDPDDAAEQIATGCDLFVVGCCWFAMTDRRYTDQQRQLHAVTFEGGLREAVTNLVDTGCPVLALHTAILSFDGAEPWASVIGGSWNWSTSWHPDPAEIDVVPAISSPVEFDAFSIVDELYQGIEVSRTATIVAESAQGDPLVWLHEGAGKAAVNLLGHDHRSLDNADHIRLNGQLLDWLLDD